MKQLKYILSLIFLVIVIYISVVFVFVKLKYKNKPAIYITNDYYSWKGGDTYYRFREFDPGYQYDLIFAGSSRAYRGYSPFVFEKNNISSFNLGSSAQTIKNTYFIVKNFVSKNNCNLLVLDVFSGAFLNADLESTSDLVENVSKPYAAYEIASHGKDIRVANIAALRFFTESDTAYYQKSDYRGRGYSSTEDSLPIEKQKQFFKHEKINFSGYSIDAEQIDYFGKLLSFCKENSVKIVCVYSPCSYFYDFSKHDAFLEMLNPTLTKYDVKLLDFSKNGLFNTAYHFYDDSHLNEAGVEIFNNELVKQLKSYGI